MGVMLKNKILVIVTPGRSGSEYLLQTLNSCSEIKLDSEVFNQSNFSASSFNGFINSRVWYKAIGFFFNRTKLSEFSFNFGLSFLIDRYITSYFVDSTRFRGFKLTLDQLEAYPHLWNILKSSSIKIIFLTKEDKLALVLSLIKARKTNYYHSTLSSKNEPYAFDINEVLEQFTWLKKSELKFMEFLKSNPQHLQLSCETMFQNFDKVRHEIIEFLNLPSATSFQYSELKPTNPSQLDEWVLNIEEIRASFSKHGLVSNQ
jgi:LPS sulfotransferase NodH